MKLLFCVFKLLFARVQIQLTTYIQFGFTSPETPAEIQNSKVIGSRPRYNKRRRYSAQNIVTGPRLEAHTRAKEVKYNR